MRLKFFLALTNDSSKMPKQGEQWQDIAQTVNTPTADQFRASTYEKTEIDKATDAKDKLQKAWDLELSAAVQFALPNLSAEIQPWGIGMSIGYGGSELGQVASTCSSLKQLDSQITSDESQQAGRRAVLVRQLQERRLEINMTGHELMKIDQEIEELKTRKSTWDAEIQAQEEEIQSTAAEETWLRNKFTNKQLYTLLDKKIGSLYHATYLLASEMTKIAKRALDFEHSLKYPNSTTRLAELAPGLTGYWDGALHGQLAGEALYLDLKRLEMLHLENKPYDFEVTKTVSLRQINSIELLKLQRTGSAQFSLPEVLFDMDYPGHYCRRIFSVAVTIPCILGAYTSLNCTLRLNKHSYRVSPNTTTDEYAKHNETDFHTDNIPIQAIAVSGGVKDTGGYSFNFPSGEDYGPFEGAGAVSMWNIDFPQTFGQFDYNTISDVVLHVHYSSLYSGSLAAVATDCAKDFVGGKGTTTETLPILPFISRMTTLINGVGSLQKMA